MRKSRMRLTPLLVVAGLATSLLTPASYGHTVAAETEPYWTMQEQVHRALDGELAYGSMLESVDITPDGRYVVFESAAQAMYADEAGEPDYTSHVYVHDRLLGRTSMIDTEADGTPANASSRKPAISDDGSRIVFQSQATNLTDDPSIRSLSPQDVDNFDRIYVYSRTSGGLRPERGRRRFGERRSRRRSGRRRQLQSRH
ncbi:TolB-like translocation protein [Cohnella rhizosphaerae]|uniref:Dipeptidylpeptidase IV N-terminal domain-containing protein n=1 Tax=Cohnella rhizosphaerae TaxID=1457232 RepID=A0A9X4KUY9_9BACL|nr:hypothetical protein [Cohnella rhizosphaerae]MDG0809349.1 hypothetical protein [Cohnella rhizosphaerae]